MAIIKRVLFYFVGVLLGAMALRACWAAVKVFALGRVDPKFGVVGSFQLDLFISAIVTPVAGAGAVLACLLIPRSVALSALSTPKAQVLAGSITGSVLACLQTPVLFNNPLVEMLPEMPAYILSFSSLGFAVSLIVVLTLVRLWPKTAG